MDTASFRYKLDGQVGKVLISVKPVNDQHIAKNHGVIGQWKFMETTTHTIAFNSLLKDVSDGPGEDKSALTVSSVFTTEKNDSISIDINDIDRLVELTCSNCKPTKLEGFTYVLSDMTENSTVKDSLGTFSIEFLREEEREPEKNTCAPKLTIMAGTERKCDVTQHLKMLFFDYGLASPMNAKPTILELQKLHTDCGIEDIRVVGHADSAGGNKSTMSWKRAEAVMNIINTANIGNFNSTDGESDKYKLIRVDGREQLNRRAEIFVKTCPLALNAFQ